MVRRQWDSTVSDLSVHRPTRHELEARKIALQSPNVEAAKRDVAHKRAQLACAPPPPRPATRKCTRAHHRVRSPLITARQTTAALPSKPPPPLSCPTPSKPLPTSTQGAPARGRRRRRSSSSRRGRTAARSATRCSSSRRSSTSSSSSLRTPARPRPTSPCGISPPSSTPRRRPAPSTTRASISTPRSSSSAAGRAGGGRSAPRPRRRRPTSPTRSRSTRRRRRRASRLVRRLGARRRGGSTSPRSTRAPIASKKPRRVSNFYAQAPLVVGGRSVGRMLEEALKQVAIRLALVGRDWVVARLVQHETKVAVGPKAA